MFTLHFATNQFIFMSMTPVFSKVTRIRLDRDLYFMHYIKTHFFFFFCMNRLHIKILIAYRQKISTTAIIAIGVIGVVNNIPPTNKQVLPHNKYTYGFEMSFFKLYRRWNLCFWNKKLSCTTLFSIWVLMSLFEKISVSSNYFFQFDLLLIKWRQSSFYPVLM